MSLKAKAPRGSGTDALREEYESTREWKLRKMFLDINVDSLPEDRLVCLSKCFINSAMYGCSYPKAVMKEIDSRSQGLLESHQQETKEERKSVAKKIYAMSFVKASNSNEESSREITCDPATHEDETKVSQQSSSCFHQSSSVEVVDMANYKGNKNEPGISTYSAKAGVSCAAVNNSSGEVMEEVDATGSHNPPEVILTPIQAATPVLTVEEYKNMSISERRPLLSKLRQLAFKTLESKEEIALNKVMNSITKGCGIRVEFKYCIPTAQQLGESYAVTVMFNNRFVATGAGRSKALARKNAMEVVLQKLYSPYLRVAKREGGVGKEIQASSEPFTDINNHFGHNQTNQLRPSVSAPAPSQNLTLPGKALVSSKDFLPMYSSLQSSGKGPGKTNKTIKATTSPQNEREQKLQKLTYPITKYSSNLANLKSLGQSEPTEKKFVIVQLSAIEEGPLSMLRRSADFSRMLLEIEHTLHSPTSVSYEIKLEGKVIGEASESNTKDAKHDAATKALEYLARQCWVLKLKGMDGKTAVSKVELFKEIQQKTDAIGEGNRGNKLLRKMGWTGGGVGKAGNGIVEPVSAEGVLGRSGLGLSSSCASGEKFNERHFQQKVRAALRQYMTSGQQEDVRFSTEFSKEERKIIHQEANKFGLRTVSRGTQDKRFLTVGHKRSSQQLLQHISECGGETNSYILLPPGSFQLQPLTVDTVSDQG